MYQLRLCWLIVQSMAVHVCRVLAHRNEARYPQLLLGLSARDAHTKVRQPVAAVPRFLETPPRRYVLRAREILSASPPLLSRSWPLHSGQRVGGGPRRRGLSDDVHCGGTKWR